MDSTTKRRSLKELKEDPDCSEARDVPGSCEIEILISQVWKEWQQLSTGADYRKLTTGSQSRRIPDYKPVVLKIVSFETSADGFHHAGRCPRRDC